MGYVYAALWFIVAIILFIRFRKENKVIYLLSLYFLIMGVWWLVNEFVEVDLLSGVYGWIFRCISVAVIIVLVMAYFHSKRRTSKSDDADE